MRVLIWLIMASAVFAGYLHYQAPPIDTTPISAESSIANPLFSAHSVEESVPVQDEPPTVVQKVAPIQPSFQCDGRQYCSQMSSLEEAEFFLRNCPDTKMDGNHDGEPCERQFGH